MSEAHPSSRHLRRIVMILVAAGTLLALLFCGFWFLLPQWTPGLVIRWSPWVEPVVRAGINNRTYETYGSDYRQRFAIWGPDAFPALSRCLRGPEDLRKAAIDAYPFMTPVSKYDVKWEPPSYSLVVLAAQPIHDDGVVWFQVRCDGTALPPIHVRKPDQLQPVAEIMARVRRDAGQAVSGEARIICELYFDASTPYWLAADIVAVSGLNDSLSPLPRIGEKTPRISHLWLTTGRPPAAYDIDQRALPFHFAPDKYSQPINLAITAGTHGGIQISIDGKAVGEIQDAPNSRSRLEAIETLIVPKLPLPETLIVAGLPPSPEQATIVLRAQPDIAWSDVVAVADACWRWSMVSYKRRGGLVLGPPLP